MMMYQQSVANAAESVLEDAGVKIITVQLDNSVVSGLDATVDYAAVGLTATGGGTDFTLVDGSVTIPANLNPAQVTFNLTIDADALDEENETLIITLSNPVNSTVGTAQTTITITDGDDPPSLAFTTNAFAVSEGTEAGQMTLTLSTVSGKDITFPYTVSAPVAQGGGVDYTLVAGTGTILAGNAGGTIDFTVIDDLIWMKMMK